MDKIKLSLANKLDEQITDLKSYIKILEAYPNCELPASNWTSQSLCHNVLHHYGEMIKENEDDVFDWYQIAIDHYIKEMKNLLKEKEANFKQL